MAIEWADITLTPVWAEDCERLNTWQNDPAVRDLIMGFRAPIRLETTIEWIRGLGGDQNLRTNWG